MISPYKLIQRPVNNLLHPLFIVLLLTMSMLNTSAQAQSLTVDFDGTESTQLEKLATQPDEQTNITAFGRDTTFYAGVSDAATPFIFNNATANLSAGDSIDITVTVYARDNTAAHNEAYIWLGPDPMGNNTINRLPVSTRQGVTAGFATHLGTIYTNNDSMSGVITLSSDTTAIFNRWVDMRIRYEVIAGNLVMSIFYDGVPVVTNEIIAPATDFSWLDNAHMGFVIDDTVDGVVLSGPALQINSPSSVPSLSMLSFLVLVTLVFASGLTRARRRIKRA
ncbi:hypothetical protein GCU85_00930 [Cardiobacteriales bacterium ML27]|uniref:Anchor protein n=2 Tax=Ostreibacterium oceani TaxID=2654998 RepID=A0A6N7F0C6_9GAMM|nr:hypothetical protein [Ostreibacterium oceani]